MSCNYAIFMIVVIFMTTQLSITIVIFKKLLGVPLTLFVQIFKIRHHDEGLTFANWNLGSPLKKNTLLLSCFLDPVGFVMY